MSKTKWTPGPWSPYCGKDTNFWWVITNSEGCELGSGDGGFEEHDAHLIAAAPELYDELYKARRTIQALIDDGYTGYTDFRSKIDAALAKARGEA